MRAQLKRNYRLGVVATTQLATPPTLKGWSRPNALPPPFKSCLRSSNKAFDISMYISTTAESPERLAQQTDEIRRVFKNRGAIFRSRAVAAVGCMAVHSLCRRGQTGDRASRHVTDRRHLLAFFTASCGTPDGVPFGFALASREPVLLNPFFRGAGKDANNMFVVGTTGAGKSFAVSMLILRLLPLGTRFVLIDKTVDKAGAYRFITDLLGPDLCAYVDLGPSSGFILNPFDLGPEDKPGEPSAERSALCFRCWT